MHGEVDIDTVQEFEVALDAAIRESDGAFIIDLSDVGFLDSSGLHVLLRARSLLGREDRALAVICRPGPIRRVLELSGTADLFFIYGSREEAVAALVPSGRSAPPFTREQSCAPRRLTGHGDPAAH